MFKTYFYSGKVVGLSLLAVLDSTHKALNTEAACDFATPASGRKRVQVLPGTSMDS